MPPERTKQLVYELEAWYRSRNVRQKDLASALELTPQALSEILALRNRPTAEQILIIQDFLKDKNMSIRLAPGQKRRTSNDDDEPLNFLTDEPNTLCQAREMVDALRAELKSKPAPAIAITPAPPEPTDSQPAPQAIQPIPAPAPKPTVHLPAASMATPSIETLSIAELRCGLQNAKDASQQSVYYQELKRREPLTSKARDFHAPPGMELVSTAEMDALQRAVEKGRSRTRQSLAATSATPAAGSPVFMIRPESPVTALDRLRCELNAEKDTAKRTALYKQIKGMEQDAKLSNPRARLRGA